MSERKINLEEILVNMFKQGEAFYNEKDIKLAMKEACRQTLELAAENTYATVVRDDFDGTYDAIINKQSILDTINQIE